MLQENEKGENPKWMTWTSREQERHGIKGSQQRRLCQTHVKKQKGDPEAIRQRGLMETSKGWLFDPQWSPFFSLQPISVPSLYEAVNDYRSSPCYITQPPASVSATVLVLQSYTCYSQSFGGLACLQMLTEHPCCENAKSKQLQNPKLFE